MSDSGLQFTDRANGVLAQSIQLANDNAHALVSPAHLELALLTDRTQTAQAPSGKDAPANESLLHAVLAKSGVNTAQVESDLRSAIRKIPQQNPPPDEANLAPPLLKAIKAADKLKVSQHDSFIAQDHLILAIIDQDSKFVDILRANGLSNIEVLKTALTQSRGARRIDSKNAEAGFDALNKYTTDLTSLASEGKIDPVIGMYLARCTAQHVLLRPTSPQRAREHIY